MQSPKGLRKKQQKAGADPGPPPPATPCVYAPVIHVVYRSFKYVKLEKALAAIAVRHDVAWLHVTGSR